MKAQPVPLLVAQSLTAGYGKLDILHDVSLTVNVGEIVSIIGPNGAGKTTVFNLITGIYDPHRGAILFEGQNVVGIKPNQITRLGIARTFQTVHLFPNMTVLENAMVGQHVRSKTGVLGAVLRTPTMRREEAAIHERARQALTFFGTRLAGYREDQPAFALSYANRRRLEVARALATDPTLVFLDEPTAGMNPRETLEMRDHIVRMRDELGLTVLLVEHDMRVVKGVSDRVIACDYGQKIAEGSFEDVANDERVIEAYLGVSATR
jgi:ABC-type branched-subunit amino acid transport system ATPase component